ncbi:MAG: hypothetical protein ACKV2O_20170 [Acidimicrobiales bacterium]
MVEFADEDLARQLRAMLPTPDVEMGLSHIRARQRRFRQRRAGIGAAAAMALAGAGLLGVQLNGDGVQRVSIEVPADTATTTDEAAFEPVRPDQIEGRSFSGGPVPRLTFDQGWVTVFGGCFAMQGGSYDPAAEAVTVRWSFDGTVPAIGCDADVDRQQGELFEWLKTSRLVWSGEGLVLTDGKRTIPLIPQPAQLASPHCVPGISEYRNGSTEDAPTAATPTLAFQRFAKVGATSVDLLYPPHDPQVLMSNADEAVLLDATALGQPVLSARVVRSGPSWSVRTWSGCSRTPLAAVLEQLSGVDWHVEAAQVADRTFNIDTLTDTGADVPVVAPIALLFSSTNFMELTETGPTECGTCPCPAIAGTIDQPLPGWLALTIGEGFQNAWCANPEETDLNAQRNILRGLIERGRVGRDGDTMVISDGQFVLQLVPV